MNRSLLTLIAVAVTAPACSESGPAWSGAVEAEVDDLTGERTGLFRTYGPTETLVASDEVIPVTLGYYCSIHPTAEPDGISDGLFVHIAMPDTSLLAGDDAAFEELSGQLSILDAARLSVNGRVYAWTYEPSPTIGGWNLDGTMGFDPPAVSFSTPTERDAATEKMAGHFSEISEHRQMIPEFEATAAELRGTPYRYEATRLHLRLVENVESRTSLVNRLDELMREEWSLAHDYVQSHYVGRDTVKLELKGVLAFEMEGFDAAVESVRFWCPAVESHHQWNTLRELFIAEMDSLREHHGI